MQDKLPGVICVCGAGTMGSGIAQLAAGAGFKTILFDVNAAMLKKSRAGIESILVKLLEKNKITDEKKFSILNNLEFTEKIENCKAQIIIEAIVEKKEAKAALFNALASVNDNNIVYATNTSSISVTEIANETPVASRIAGMHFFNPAPVMKLVEIVNTEKTDKDVIETLVTFAKQMGKTPVICQDSPGFIVNHVARHYYLESLLLLEKGLSDAETIDKVMEATGFKMGPFKLMDLIGIDINYSVSKIVWEALGKPTRLQPSDLQGKKVSKGEFGKKTGKGFYNYNQ